jgi:hypothetical protein
LVVHGANLPVYGKMTKKLGRQYALAMKTVEKKRRNYRLQSQTFNAMEYNPELRKYMDTLNFINKEGEICRFTKLQKQDMGLIHWHNEQNLLSVYSEE